MNTKQVRISELSGAELDWAVAHVEGHTADPYTWLYEATVEDVADSNGFRPSSDWSQGGPIIEREGINLGTQRDEPGFRWHPDALWHAQLDIRVYISYGPTPLVAAMRCYVVSKLGDTITLITSE